MPLGVGIPPKKEAKEGHPIKRRYSTVRPIGSSNVKMVADRHRHAAYYNKHWRELLRNVNIDDLE